MTYFLYWGVVEKSPWVNDKPHRSCPQDPPWALAQVVGGSHLLGPACPLCLLFVLGLFPREKGRDVETFFFFFFFAGVIKGVLLLEGLTGSVLALSHSESGSQKASGEQKANCCVKWVCLR